jgi:hypothetical protein
MKRTANGARTGGRVCINPDCLHVVRVGPPCWDCGQHTNPVVRPDRSSWWGCLCGRIVPANNGRWWIEAAANKRVDMYLFPHEWDKEMS